MESKFGNDHELKPSAQFTFGRNLVSPLCRSSELGLIKLNLGIQKNKNRMCQLLRSDTFSYKESKYKKMVQLKFILVSLLKVF